MLLTNQKLRNLLALIVSTFCIFTYLALEQQALAQSNIVKTDSFYIKDVLIECHQKTIDRIILREMAYKKGDRIAKANIDSVLQKEANKIFNTRLFVVVDVYPIPVKGDTINLLVSLVERWYLYPIPIFELADRNFNEWWKQRNRDMSRVNYGLRLTQENVRGRNETLKLLVQLGFVERYGIEYKIPYINRDQTTGLVFKIDFAQNKNLAYRTDDNKLSFLRSEDVLRERFWTSLGFSKRKAFYNTHHFIAGFDYQSISDSIYALNPDYLNNQGRSQRYFYLNYIFNHDSRDMATYPLNGSYLNFSVAQKGLSNFDDLHQFEIKFVGAKFFHLSKSTASMPLFFATSVRGFISFPSYRPYSELQGFGYRGDFVRGYELYVVDGQHFGIWKNTLRWRLFSIRANLRKFMPLEQFSTLPIAAYLKTYSDVGYIKNDFVAESNKRLTNTMLWGKGIGLDVLIYNSLLWRFEYSRNRQGEWGFFFGFEADF
ncbi:BamA/TamA family outer membrane protein [Thermoflexibacter ruber]|uniref:BamA/TamA family outer membrane protein n=1 Tax=Thermoflexibacter ruber TaxID=1003 RepID=UPI000B876F5A|nr:BamA/TamA family outer membrane protein [Thermoflexibacter ruber]